MSETNTPNPVADDASEPKSVSQLETEIESLATEKLQCEQEIQRLRAEENPAEGVFHAQEIFAAQQDKLRLEVEIDIRRRAIRRQQVAEQGW